MNGSGDFVCFAMVHVVLFVLQWCSFACFAMVQFCLLCNGAVLLDLQ